VAFSSKKGSGKGQESVQESGKRSEKARKEQGKIQTASSVDWGKRSEQFVVGQPTVGKKGLCTGSPEKKKANAASMSDLAPNQPPPWEIRGKKEPGFNRHSAQRCRGKRKNTDYELKRDADRKTKKDVKKCPGSGWPYSRFSARSILPDGETEAGAAWCGKNLRKKAWVRRWERQLMKGIRPSPVCGGGETPY